MEPSSLLPIQDTWSLQDLSSLQNTDGNDANKLEQAAKDFESVLLQKLLEQMSQTVGEWGFEKDGASQQIQGMFWSLMAQTLADNGGLGLWQDIQQAMTAHPVDPVGTEGVNQVL